jgi:hypothetical protein
MISPADRTDWRDLREFRHVDLESSFVLGWQLDGDTLCVDLDLHLEPGHVFYEAPRPAEKVCIRPAVLEFPHCESLSRPDDGAGADMGALVAALGIGNIESLVVYGDGVYELSGKFGTVVIDASRAVLRLTGTWPSHRSDGDG